MVCVDIPASKAKLVVFITRVIGVLSTGKLVGNLINWAVPPEVYWSAVLLVPTWTTKLVVLGTELILEPV